jgi:hypothetical protein
MCEGGFSLIKPTTRHWNTVITVMSVLIVAEIITFLLATLVHLGIPVPLGFTQPQIIPAAIVEGLCGIFLAVSAYAVFAHKTWAWRVALAAHVFAVAGVLLGILATIRSSAGGEPNFIPPPPADPTGCATRLKKERSLPPVRKGKPWPFLRKRLDRFSKVGYGMST